MSTVIDRHSSRIHPRVLAAAVAAFILAVAVADWVSPLGYVEWVFYIGPVALAATGRNPSLPLVAAFFASILLVLGYSISDEVVIQHSVALINRGFGVGVVSVMGVIGAGLVQTRVQVAREVWLRTGANALQAKLEGNPSMDEVGELALACLGTYLRAEVGAFHASAHGQVLQRVAVRGVAPGEAGPDEVRWGETLVGQCAESNTLRRIGDLPPGYFTIRSAVGAAAPRELVLVPLLSGDVVNGVLELGFFRELDDLDLELLERIRGMLGVAIRSADYRDRVDHLLGETQRQAEQLQTQQEELRVTNEELESQANALLESQRRMEEQNVDLERTNAELEEQTAQLEERQQELVQARLDLEQANRHKSEFLANMSHELRTPLNSTLILAKILSENAPGTMNEEQVKFAETIYAAGNDLLTLISDILDLSKIEAGRMDVTPAPVRTGSLLERVERMVRPLAQDKELSFEVVVDDDAPPHLVTDRQRVQQILRNLLSNALKFTEQGGVTVQVSRHPRGIAVRVRDTGIGIAPEDQQKVFEPFRQVDTEQQEAHGGTGLGLAISRNMARVLGGDLTVESTLGQGSTFTLVLPLATSADRPPEPDPEVAPEPVEEQALPPSGFVADDRDRIVPGVAHLLIIEDDPRFATIVVSLARDIGLPCIVSRDPAEGMAMARKLRPTGIVLDVRLPEESGLTVLDRLKRDPGTRHIPVHMVSAYDYSETALRLGAVGYAVKPVVPDQLVDAFRRLQRTASDEPRSVLVVEDDPVQRESICRLIATERVTTDAVGTVQGALELLQERTFDCMIVDLRLADGSGFDLLDQLAEGDRYSFPPVIVYTGQSLTAEEEQRLREYSQSVIVKGARSPERLLDEVALFLHQVEQTLPPEHQRMLRVARSRDAALEDRRILVVEDDVRNVFALTSLLEPRGAIVEIARNGQEALDRLEEQPPVDLVLMDVMMPVMDGLQATRRIRQRPELHKLPIIMLTAKAMRDDQEKCLAAGANDYASKPLDVDKLLSLVRVWMPPRGRR